jgi:hypothetical protein
MAKLLVHMDDERLADLKELALRHKTSMADLVRFAIEETFEDDLDAIAGQRGWEEYLRDPSSAMSLDDYLKERGIVLSDTLDDSASQEPRSASRERPPANPSGRKRAAKQPVS